MQRSLLRLARRQSSLWPAGQRAFSQPTGQLTPGELAVAEESPFLRFASPVPQPTTYAPLLSSIPDTSVCLILHLKIHIGISET